MKAESLQIFGDMDKVARGGGAVLLGSLFGNGLSYLYSIFLARNLGATAFGVYALGLTIFNIIILIAPLGFETGALRFISQALGRNDRSGAEKTIVQVMTLVLLSSLTMGATLALASRWLATTVYADEQLTRVLLWFAAIIPLAVFSSVLLDVIRSFQLVRYTVLVKYVWEPCGKFVLAAALLWAGYALGGVLAALLMTTACSVIIALTAARRIVKFGTEKRPALTAQGLRSLFVYCLPLTVTNVFGVIAPRSDMLILGMWASAAQVGVYSVVSQTASILALVLGAFTTMCTPVIGDMAATHDLGRLEVLYKTVARWTTMCTVPLFCLLALFGDTILTLCGKGFAAGALTLGILALGQVIYSTAGLASTILLMFGHSIKVMGNTIVLAVFLIGSNFLLVPRWGIVGAATATSLSSVTFGLITLWQVRTLYGVQPLSWSLIKPVIAGGLGSIVAWTAKGMVPSLNPLPIAVGAVVYCASLFLLRFEAADRQVFGLLVTSPMSRDVAITNQRRTKVA